MVATAGKIKRWTYEDYAAIPDDVPTYVRYEVLDGELLVSPSPGVPHQRVLMLLAAPLVSYVSRNCLGEIFVAPLDVVLSDNDTVQPDIIFVSNERRGILTEPNLQGAPDLVVEIISPTSDRRDRVAKFHRYETFGIPHYWIIDPVHHTVEEHVLSGGTYETTADVEAGEVFEPRCMPGLRIDLNHIFG